MGRDPLEGLEIATLDHACQREPDGFNHAAFCCFHQQPGRPLDLKPAQTFLGRRLTAVAKMVICDAINHHNNANTYSQGLTL